MSGDRKLSPNSPTFLTAAGGEALATGGKNMVGKPCANHARPIIEDWMELALGFCLCGLPMEEPNA